MDISAWIDRHAAFKPDKTAIRFEGRDISYARLAARIGSITDTLISQYGVAHGDRVGYLGHNHPNQFALLFACARIGAIFMPLNWRLEVLEHREIVLDCTPKILIVDNQFEALGQQICTDLLVEVVHSSSVDESAAAAKPVKPANYDNPVLLCYTSGATGRPKGVVLDQNALFFNAVNSAHMHGMTGDDIVLNTLPLFHVGGINIQSLPVLHAGGTLVLHPVFDVSSTFDALEHDYITLTVLVPTQIAAMLADDRWQSAEFKTLRMIATGSTMVPGKLIEKVHQRGIPVIQVYGSTETAPLATYQLAADSMANVGSAGKVAIHCEMRIVDGEGIDVDDGKVGEILIKGPNVMREYWNAPQITATVLIDGWFHTGDVGHLDSSGFLYVSDRKKDMIISGGENIYSAELENILAENPDVAEAAVVGAPHEVWGESVVALVVKKREISEAAIIEIFEGRLARYKHPREVVFLDALPRNAMGKVIKDQLRRLVAEKPQKRQAG